MVSAPPPSWPQRFGSDDPRGGAPAAVHACWLGRLSFDDAEIAQDVARDEVAAGAPDRLLLLELEPTITSGRRESWADLLLTPSALAARGVALRVASRGGRLTWHGPGQLVAYACLDLRRRGRSGAWLVRALCAGVSEWLVHRGHRARWDDEEPGVWVEWPEAESPAHVPPRKIASVGLRVAGGISRHGLALNLHVDPAARGWFRACGTSGERLISLHELEPTPPPTAAEAAASLAPLLASAMGCG